MSEFLPEDVRGALARGGNGPEGDSMGRAPSLRVVARGREYPVRRRWAGGFAFDLSVAPELPGLVDLYDGERHIFKALVFAARDEGDERVFEVKFANTAIATPPAVDFARTGSAPVAVEEETWEPATASPRTPR